MTRNVLIVGHSHVGAIREAAVRRREAGTGTLAVRTIHVMDPVFGGEFAPGAEGQRYSPGLLAAFDAQRARHAPLVFSVLCGNMHAVHSLVEQDRPFDFMLSGEPSPKLDPRAEIRAEADVHAWLAAAMQVDLDRLTLFHDAVGHFVQIESPPPVAARSFIARRLEPYFSEQPAYARNGITPGGIRYRMWRLSSRITAAHCAKLGCGYLPSPAAVRDASGFLDQRFAADSTHGNGDYGEAVIQMIETHLADRQVAVGASGGRC